MFEEYIIQPVFKGLGNESLSEFQSVHESLALYDYIKKYNIDHSAGDVTTFFGGIPDEKELAFSLDFPVNKLLIHLNVAAMMEKLYHISFEMSSHPVTRKTSGYVAADRNTIGVLIERCEHNLIDEYRRRVKVDATALDIVRRVQPKIQTLESTTIGKLVRIHTSLNHVRSHMAGNLMLGTSQYAQVMERRTWKIIELKINQYHNESRFESEEKISKESGRRAEDSSEFKNLEASKGVDWDQSFHVIGPFLTVRILLRRELFDIILAWARSIEGHQDLAKILSDCETTLKALEQKNFDPLALRTLQEIIDTLQPKVYRNV